MPEFVVHSKDRLLNAIAYPIASSVIMQFLEDVPQKVIHLYYSAAKLHWQSRPGWQVSKGHRQKTGETQGPLVIAARFNITEVFQADVRTVEPRWYLTIYAVQKTNLEVIQRELEEYV